MDTSKEYVLMCQKAAQELSKLRGHAGLETGDHSYTNTRPYEEFLAMEEIPENEVQRILTPMVHLLYDEDVVVIREDTKPIGVSLTRVSYITLMYTWWLPRIDQFCKLMTDQEKHSINKSAHIQMNRMNAFMATLINKWKWEPIHINYYIPKTHEQWWLCLIMNWCFNKRWDIKSKEWILI